MSYHDLSECTLTPDERYAEALRIIGILEQSQDDLRENEKDMMSKVEHYESCSVKQLFWLRDIKDRVL
jgi:hypothetical protein